MAHPHRDAANADHARRVKAMSKGGMAHDGVSEGEAKRIVTKGIREHEDAEHGGRHEKLHLASGGRAEHEEVEGRAGGGRLDRAGKKSKGKGNHVNISVVYKGGDTRAQSVLAGLKYLESKGASKDAWVLVHDAARCLVTAELVKHLISNCYADTVGGLLAVPVADTLKQEEGGRAVSTISRDTKWAAQTPQMFRLGMLGTALEEGLKLSAGSKLHAVTDESSAIEAYGYKALLVSGSTTNLKITYPADFEIAQAIIRSRC